MFVGTQSVNPELRCPRFFRCRFAVEEQDVGFKANPARPLHVTHPICSIQRRIKNVKNIDVINFSHFFAKKLVIQRYTSFLESVHGSPGHPRQGALLAPFLLLRRDLVAEAFVALRH